MCKMISVPLKALSAASISYSGLPSHVHFSLAAFPVGFGDHFYLVCHHKCRVKSQDQSGLWCFDLVFFYKLFCRRESNLIEVFLSNWCPDSYQCPYPKWWGLAFFIQFNLDSRSLTSPVFSPEAARAFILLWHQPRWIPALSKNLVIWWNRWLEKYSPFEKIFLRQFLFGINSNWVVCTHATVVKCCTTWQKSVIFGRTRSQRCLPVF